MPYLAPGDIPTTFVCRRLTIPEDLDIIIAVNGALNELTKAQNWEQTGGATPDEIAALCEVMFRDFIDSTFTCP